MEKIASFRIDHTKLLPGVYVSRRDITANGDVLTTFDIRITAPNREPALSGESIHALEHLGATYLRNDGEWKERVVYFGPMGCLTGCYLILQGELEPMDIMDLLRGCFSYISTFNGEIPGASPRDCGNYSFMDGDGARAAARKFLSEVLENPSEERTTYPV